MQDTVGMNRDIRGPKLAGARGEAVAFSQSQEEKTELHSCSWGNCQAGICAEGRKQLQHEA